MRFRADEAGIWVSRRVAGSYDVLFDEHAAWSFSVKARRGRGQRLVRWPNAMRPWLQGTAQLTLRDSTGGASAQRIDLGRVAFGEVADPIEFVDKAGRPVMIDKWGIVQRPFETRGAAVTAEIAARSDEVMEILRRDCGIEAWIAFGTLLGAARAGKAIGHDSDVDLLYLSEHSAPAEIALECYRIKRALTGAGIKAVVKSGSFVTALFPGPDGVALGVDVYACFYVGDLLHETATVRAPVPREAILPLTTMEFEGRQLPAPAQADVLLEASYGAGWRVPDPSFRHTPGPEITERFDAWFGSTMTNRRAWETWWREHLDLSPRSTLAGQLAAEVAPGPGPVIELGAGNGSDALALARAGLRVVATDYARHSWRAARQQATKDKLRLRFMALNLYDLRDVFSFASLMRRGPAPRAVLARGVIDSLHPRAHEHLWRACRMLLRAGGRVYLEFDEPTGRTVGRYQRGEHPYGYAVSIDQVRASLAAVGARVVRAEQVPVEPVADGESDGPAVRRWHVVAEWA